ncbi:MAG: PspC domain-containing protein [Candidatus Shapirobacteria bacterium]|nr:PspC domain-containing protein [Candidatus Shapirobacteria bacterium]
MENKKIFRSIDDYMIAGVCGGLAKYFKIDSSLIRIIFILLALSGGSGILIYLILWLVVPKEEGIEKEIDREEKIKEFAGEIKSKAKSMAKEIKIDTKIKKVDKKVNILGIILILVGVVAIWNQLAPFTIQWNLFWPGLLILVGILVLFKD